MATTKTKEPNAKGVDAWLAKLPRDQRDVLTTLRAQIVAAGPELIETIAYNVPMYYVGTSQVLGMSAAKEHVALGIGAPAIAAVGDALAGYDVALHTIRFTPEKPLPATLVKKLVKACIAAHAAKKSSAMAKTKSTKPAKK